MSTTACRPRWPWRSAPAPAACGTTATSSSFPRPAMATRRSPSGSPSLSAWTAPLRSATPPALTHPPAPAATALPGNEITVSRTVNNLYRRGARVVTRRRGTETEHIHVSGHASREEIRDMLRYVQPRYCVPLHGEYRNLVQFRALAGEMGVP